jgi:copper resistance protein B
MRRLPAAIAWAALASAAAEAPAAAQQAAGGGHAGHAMPPAAAPPAAQDGTAASAAASEAARAPDIDTGGHFGHSPLYFGAVLFDQNELRSTGRGSPIYAWEGSGYYGTDYHRVWVNARGETNRDRGGLERAELQVLYSRLLGYYWDAQAGVRHDFRIDPSRGTPSRTYGMVALQGLAPGFFEVQLQAFFGEGGVALARAAASYDLLITNRLILQPEAELNFSSGWDRDALIAPGLYRTEVGLRLRYEITREFAPYIGYSYESFNGGSSGLNRRIGEKPSQSTVVAGVRLFF